MPNAILGGAQVQLSAFERLSPAASLGNPYGAGGGFAKSPLAGSLVRLRTRLETDATTLGEVALLVPLSDAATVKTQAPTTTATVVEVVTPVVAEAGASSGTGAPGGGAPGSSPGSSSDGGGAE